MESIKERIDQELKDVHFQKEEFKSRLESEIRARERRREARWKRAAAAAALLLVVSGGGTYAAVSYFQERGSQMPQEEREAYVEERQNSSAEANTYSRELTEEERERKEELKEKYIREGVYPKRKLLRVSGEEEVDADRVCFQAETSTFYLPERELSDEDLLEIIDYELMLDYSLAHDEEVKQKKKEIEAEQENWGGQDGEIGEEEAIAIAAETVTREYGVDLEGIKTDAWRSAYDGSEAEAFSDGIVTFFMEDGRQYEVQVDLFTGEVKSLIAGDEQIDLEGKVKPDDVLDQGRVEELEREARLFLGEEAPIRKKYVRMVTDAEGYLNFGVVHYYFEMGDECIVDVAYSVLEGRTYLFGRYAEEEFWEFIERVKEDNAGFGLQEEWIELED